MSVTPSTMLPLGTSAPDFRLPNCASGEPVALGDFASSKGLLVIFLCAHCPFVHHVSAELARLGQEFQKKGIAFVGISSNDAAEYPDDAPEPTTRFAAQQGFTFPVLYDETQAVAKAYRAACTPDFFLFGSDRRLVYRGRIDASRPGRGEADGADLRAAFEAVLHDAVPSADQHSSVGCNIKWKAGHAPEYYAA